MSNLPWSGQLDVSSPKEIAGSGTEDDLGAHVGQIDPLGGATRWHAKN